MEDHIEENFDNPTKAFKRGALYILVIFVISFVLLETTKLILKIKATDFIQYSTSIPTEIKTVEKVKNQEYQETNEFTNIDETNNVQIIPSKSNKYFFLLFAASNKKSINSSCDYKIVNQSGDTMEKNTIKCSYNAGEWTAPSFIGWLNEDVYIFSEEPGKIDLQNVTTRLSYSYYFDNAELELIGGSATSDKFMFTKWTRENFKNFVVKDLEMNTLAEYAYVGNANYDFVNNGYLITEKICTDICNEIRIHYVDMDTLQAKTIFSGESVQPMPSYCKLPGDKISFSENKVIINGGCLQFLDKALFDVTGQLILTIN